MAVYLQMINSLYDYGIPMNVLRPYDLDRLGEMRYVPQFSHLYINNTLFMSFVSKVLFDHDGVFQYNERSWLRCCSGEKIEDVVLVDINQDLSNLRLPDLALLRVEQVEAGRLFFAMN